LPTRRVSAALNSPGRPKFAAVLQQATATAPKPAPRPVSPAAPDSRGGPAPISRSDIIATAQRLLAVPYVWGSNTADGLDCSAYVSKAWGVSRQTTETLASVATSISKDELQAGDALNLTMAADSRRDGHVRIFDKWADAAHTRMWVYEETVPRAVHHVIPWDARYTPLRRQNVIA
jgi:cell wall-associated NlpC family hydrolase